MCLRRAAYDDLRRNRLLQRFQGTRNDKVAVIRDRVAPLGLTLVGQVRLVGNMLVTLNSKTLIKTPR